ncbi:MAG: hypothetical protein PHP17_07700 [Candidatus Omnitrophica bacterium]|nr:hypothetical protein [Candidatus Omnitrophota bacterium]
MCYAGPVAGAIVSSVIWGKTKSTKVWWLSLLYWGGALFGVIDHLWNGELFLISGDVGKDLLLGVVITASIFVFWLGALLYQKYTPQLQYTKA